ncbi:hypothetical protein [Undibacterium sp. RuTC16W]|uniref:hypothetical protein n=1 Tax=Undibacterium sp. RuTC16W TaxID=3413048 RepID=UPI003BF42B80
MNLLKTQLSKAMITSLIVLMPVISISHAAYAGTASRSSGSSHSFKGGFSSQKSAMSRSSNNGTISGSNGNVANDRKAGNSSFGSFGSSSAVTPATPAKSTSALNRDMDNSRSQATAMKNLDARNGKNSDAERNLSVTGKPLEPVRTGFGNTPPAAQAGAGANANWTGNANAGAPATPVATPAISAAPQTIIVQREHSSMGGMFMGFMLGQALSRPHTTVNVDNRPRDTLPIDSNNTNSSSQTSGVTNKETADQATNAKAKPEESESLGWSLLRVTLWTALLGGLGWMIYKWRQVSKHRQEVRSNYTLGKV